MYFGFLLRTIEIMILNARNSSEHCSNTGSQVAEFCIESTYVFSSNMYIGARNMSNKYSECYCNISSPTRVPLYISLAGSAPLSHCESRLKVIANNRFTLDCWDDMYEGEIANVFPDQPITIKFLRTSRPTDMCIKYFIAHGNPNVTMSCYKEGYNPLEYTSLPVTEMYTSIGLTWGTTPPTPVSSGATKYNSSDSYGVTTNNGHQFNIADKMNLLFVLGSTAAIILLLASLITFAILCCCKDKKPTRVRPNIGDNFQRTEENGHAKIVE